MFEMGTVCLEQKSIYALALMVSPVGAFALFDLRNISWIFIKGRTFTRNLFLFSFGFDL